MVVVVVVVLCGMWLWVVVGNVGCMKVMDGEWEMGGFCYVSD
jgi:hypothetical protein